MYPSRKHVWVRLGVAFFVLYQIQAVSVIDRTLYGEWSGKPGDKFTQLLFISQIALSATFFYKGLRHWRSIRKGASLWLYLAAFLACTAIWSVNSAGTIREDIQYTSLIIAAIGVAEILQPDEFMNVFAQACFLSAAASLVLLVVWPAAVHQGADFRGVISQKNQLGEAMSMGALACLHGIWAERRGRSLRMIMFLTIFVVTVLSGSTTSLLTIVMFVGLGAVLHKFGTKALLIAAPLILISFLGQDLVIEMLGKDPTLTGRTDIWARVIPDITQSPVLGWGYSAFWTPGNPAADRISNAVGWRVPQAHNGLLEIMLSAGLVGAAAYLYLLLRAFRLSIRCIRTNSVLGVTGFLSCAGIVVNGVSENVLIYPGSLTVVFFISTFFCERALWEARRQRFEPAPQRALHLSSQSNAILKASHVPTGRSRSRLAD